MRYLNDIQLEQAIIHAIKLKSGQGLQLSEVPLPLDANPRVAEFFIQHIRKGLHSAEAKAAHFEASGGEAPCGWCPAILRGDLDLVTGSQRLAERLHGIIENDKRVSECALVLCIYYDAGEPGARYLALLKVDPTEVIRTVEEVDEQGRHFLNIQLETGVLPTARENLQKCAFLQAPDAPAEYDMLLLDRQAHGADAPPARFFVQDFLGAALVLDARRRTELFYQSVVIAHNQLRYDGALSASEEIALEGALEQAVQTTSLDVDAWINALPLPEPHREQIRGVVTEKLPDTQFEIDATYGKTKLVGKRRFHGDHGLRLTVPTEYYDQMVTVEKVTDSDGLSVFQITIKTEKWEEPGK
jgi:nucleoid-associated protein YejK